MTALAWLAREAAQAIAWAISHVSVIAGSELAPKDSNNLAANRRKHL